MLSNSLMSLSQEKIVIYIPEVYEGKSDFNIR